MKKYNKLVRDKIPEILKKKGITFTSHSAEVEEFREKLIAKLHEEVAEFTQSPSEEELADILEFIDAVVSEYSFSHQSIKQCKNKKLKERGGFTEKIILDEVNE